MRGYNYYDPYSPAQPIAAAMSGMMQSYTRNMARQADLEVFRHKVARQNMIDKRNAQMDKLQIRNLNYKYNQGLEDDRQEDIMQRTKLQGQAAAYRAEGDKWLNTPIPSNQAYGKGLHDQASILERGVQEAYGDGQEPGTSPGPRVSSIKSKRVGEGTVLRPQQEQGMTEAPGGRSEQPSTSGGLQTVTYNGKSYRIDDDRNIWKQNRQGLWENSYEQLVTEEDSLYNVSEPDKDTIPEFAKKNAAGFVRKLESSDLDDENAVEYLVRDLGETLFGTLDSIGGNHVEGYEQGKYDSLRTAAQQIPEAYGRQAIEQYERMIAYSDVPDAKKDALYEVLDETGLTDPIADVRRMVRKAIFTDGEKGWGIGVSAGPVTLTGPNNSEEAISRKMNMIENRAISKLRQENIIQKVDRQGHYVINDPELKARVRRHLNKLGDKELAALNQRLKGEESVNLSEAELRDDILLEYLIADEMQKEIDTLLGSDRSKSIASHSVDAAKTAGSVIKSKQKSASEAAQMGGIKGLGKPRKKKKGEPSIDSPGVRGLKKMFTPGNKQNFRYPSF